LLATSILVSAAVADNVAIVAAGVFDGEGVPAVVVGLVVVI
jgi:hypothetical protein